jgi:hypothetical protein
MGPKDGQNAVARHAQISTFRAQLNTRNQLILRGKYTIMAAENKAL